MDEESRAVGVVKAAIAVPTFAVLAAASIAVHTSISAAVIAYNVLWRRRQRAHMLRRELGPGVYYAN
jgi:hypothetical protein